ncbi:MAG: NADPH-dependent 7-cyano-7-deazaguanine reductase QueF [Syntrophaceae bacterium]|nr:NADPH-dependent 7-cyano-7-deazaguanine reductase QueF [Syntrophaceae bacterium]
MTVPPYRDTYDPGLLQPVPRTPHRMELGIGDSLPFSGADIWTAYELSWLDPKGKPQVAMATFVVPADTPNLVESKSLKLYLNSFNQTPVASPEDLRETLRRDLGGACGAPVGVEIRLPEDFGDERIEELDGESIDAIDVETRDYSPNPGHLRTGPAPAEETLVSNLLKTNCPLTGQPDWAGIQIRYSGPRIDRAGLLRYLVSFRRHGGFHEHCTERIFMDILRRCRPARLTVYARYTRRGGLDINPFRTNCGEKVPRNVRTARQ